MQTGQRVLFSDNGVISDVTITVNDFDEYALTPGIVAAQDYIYIGTTMPFNHKWIEVGTVNSVASVMSVYLWHDSAWQAAYQYTDAENIRKGVAGTYSGAKIQIDNNIYTSANGSLGAVVYYSLLLGKGALGVTELDGGVKTYMKKSGDQDTSNPINQFVTFGWKANMVPKILNANCGLILYTCDAA